LLFIPQLPSKPAYLRVKVWRRLQARGAAALKNAVHSLPNTDEAREFFDALRAEIAGAGGEALVIEARLVGGMTDSELRGVFDAARDAEYDDLAREVRERIDSQETGGADVARFRARLTEIAEIDFFGAHGRQAAEAAIAEADHRARTHPDVANPHSPEVDMTRLQGRTWVTRRHIHVDRIASAWLIRRFIDPQARFKFVGGAGYAPEPGELRFDMADAEFTHEDDRCSFEILTLRAGLDADPGLSILGQIIHDLDIGDARFNRPETAGVIALIAGVCTATEDDEARIAQASSALDGLYAHFSRTSAPA